MDATGFHPRPLPPGARLAAAERLVEASGQAARDTARRIVDSGSSGGIGFEHAYATIEPGTNRVREVALAVPSPGRSALVFLSRPQSGRERPDERAECVRAVCQYLAQLPGQPIDIAQSLPAAAERWAIDALLAANWQTVGSLAYMRRPLRAEEAARSGLAWAKPGSGEPLPDGLEIEPIRVPGAEEPAPPELIEALEASYIDTLDCPDLCGMRETADIIASHAAIGRQELALWSLLRHEGRPAGALLLSCLPEQRCYELVYLGLGPSLRGNGYGELLMRRAIETLATRVRQSKARAGWSITCAVDKANRPAVRLYERLGFAPFDSRVACVWSVRPD
ncbi:MAG: GNAT family N-acetyltransferase [Phycisphaerales bacterium]